MMNWSRFRQIARGAARGFGVFCVWFAFGCVTIGLFDFQGLALAFSWVLFLSLTTGIGEMLGRHWRVEDSDTNELTKEPAAGVAAQQYFFSNLDKCRGCGECAGLCVRRYSETGRGCCGDCSHLREVGALDA